MTQRNIEAMDIIVTKMAEGMTLSKALEKVYTKRVVQIPYKEEYFDELITDFGMSRRSTNALLRGRMRKISDVIKHCNEKKITDIAGLGVGSGIEVMETILDHCWNNMSQDEKTNFLINTVERNSKYIRAEIEL